MRDFFPTGILPSSKEFNVKKLYARICFGSFAFVCSEIYKIIKLIFALIV